MRIRRIGAGAGVIESSLHAKTGEVLLAESHADYMDFPVRDSRTTISEARVIIATENFAAPIIAALNRKTAIDTYPELQRALAEVISKHPTREDARRVLEWHIKVSRPHPQARWHIAGAETVPRNVRFITVATMPRFSATSFTADPLARGVRFIGEADRMDEVDETVDDLIPKLDVELWGAALLQRDTRVKPTGGGTKSRIKKDRPPSSSEIREAKRRRQQEDGLEAPKEKYFARVRPEVKNALQRSGVGPKLIEAVGLALLRGKTVEEIRAGLAE